MEILIWIAVGMIAAAALVPIIMVVIFSIVVIEDLWRASRKR